MTVKWRLCSLRTQAEMKKIVSIIVLLCSTLSFAQSENEVRRVLKSISSLDHADSLTDVYPSWYIRINKTLSLGPAVDSQIADAKVGDIIRSQYSDNGPIFLRKLVVIGTEEVCKVSYIYLDGRKHNLSEISEIRKRIIDQYTQGASFTELVNKYNEDGNPTGELNWFYKGMMVEDFDRAVRLRNAGEIFTVDVPENSWYYVVLKSEDNKFLECRYSVDIRLGN